MHRRRLWRFLKRQLFLLFGKRKRKFLCFVGRNDALAGRKKIMSYQTEDTSAFMGGEPLPVPPEAPITDQTRAKKKLNYAFFIILLAIASLAGVCFSFLLPFILAKTTSL